jgi:hypothetical protein
MKDKLFYKDLNWNKRLKLNKGNAASVPMQYAVRYTDC